ncbi:phr [Symbiodinium sp. CCMP2592]|nr:phr [Symbiodinium sp. CCMP2592]
MILPPIDGGVRAAPAQPRSDKRRPSEPERSTSLKAVQLKSQIKAKFHELDVNKDGCLSFEELTVFLGCLSTKLTEKEVREIFRTMDRNRDEKVQFDEFVDFIFSSEMDKNPRLLADVEAAAKRSTNNVARVESTAARERAERLHAEKAGRDRLGRLEGRYAFRWQGDADEAESFELILRESGKFESMYFSQLGAGMTDKENHSGAWEVSATEREILLYKEGGGPVERWALDAHGDLDAGKDFALSKQRMVLRSDDDCFDVAAALKSLQVDRTVGPVSKELFTPGAAAGKRRLEEFVRKRLTIFGKQRNDPTKQALSGLSPWIKFGQISAQRCALVVKKAAKGASKAGADDFLEESIVRRELADNFCWYNQNYDSLKGASAWAVETLKKHSKDKREYVYSRLQLEKAQTHDELWNAAQRQMVSEGKMHGFLRMYWAKKVLEWSKDPATALATAIYLNDRYNLDGREPNGYVGCMWSICGVHDMGWPERKIFGKIRYMNYEGCKRKFNVKDRCCAC